MLIDKNDILTTINKLLAAGKQLPQQDRIRYSKSPSEEREAVILETARLWWDLFNDRKIGKDRWEEATDKAMTISGIPRLDTQVINTQLMSVALQKVEEEYLSQQEARHEEQKHQCYTPINFPEMGRLIAWHMKYHKHPLLSLPSADIVRAWGRQHNFASDDIERNMIQLRVFLCFCQHATRDHSKMPLKMTLDENRYLRIHIVA